MIKKLLFLSTMVLLAACTKQAGDDLVITDPVAPAAVYTITEGFENSVKPAYAAADVSAPTGFWNFDDAVIGNLPADLKSGNKSVRLRAGKLSMNFDVKGMTMLYVKHGKYGSDAASSWQLLISSDSGATYTQVGEDIMENNTTLKLDSFLVTPGAGVRFRIQKKGSARINIDDITFKGLGDPGLVTGTPDSNPADSVSSGTAAMPRGINAGPDAQPAAGDNSNALFGNPSSANALLPDNFLLDQHYYVESYSSSRGTPNWVSWHLSTADFSGVADRQNNFAAFTGLPAGAFQVQSNSYTGSGFDRGHNTPSADRTSSTAANSATFLMSNMIPQAPQNNQHTWADLENYLRAVALQGNEVYIIMGSYGTGGVGSSGSAGTIASGKVTVPSNVWKVAVILPNGDNDLSRVAADTRIIAVNTPNINTIDAEWKKYRVTVRAIEKATGYDLLSNLPKSVQDAIETKVDTF